MRARFLIGTSVSLLMLLASGSSASAAQQKLTAPDGASNESFGKSVAVDGDTLVVGSKGANANKGAVYVYDLVGGTWTYSAKLTASDGANADSLGSAVAIDGDTIVAGAVTADVGANQDQGAVYTFSRTGPPARTQTAKLTASDGAASDFLGGSVAIDGDTIVAGSAFDDVGANQNQGSAYVFDSTGVAARNEKAKLTAAAGDDYGNFGDSVAIDGDTIVVGAPFSSPAGSGQQGSAYTFARSGPAARTETARLTASDAADHDQFGDAVAIDGDTIVVGAPVDDVGSNSNQGSAYTFARTGLAVRTETAKLTASDGAFQDDLGSSVAIDGDTIVAGALFSDFGSSTDQGSVYAFPRTGAAVRAEKGKLVDSDGAINDSLGFSVAIDGNAIAAGAPGDRVAGNFGQGSADVFDVPADVSTGISPPPGTTPPSSSADTTAPDTLGLKGPKKVRRGKKAKFSFSSSESPSTFRCKVDTGSYVNCGSPFTLKTKRLKGKKHTISVAAIDSAGNVDPTPAQAKLKLKPKKKRHGKK